MDRALQKLYSGRKELRKTEPAFLRGQLSQVPLLQLGELSKGSVDSLRSPRSETCRLPKIAKMLPGRGSVTQRCGRMLFRCCFAHSLPPVCCGCYGRPLTQYHLSQKFAR